jgi:hypothetical protein
MSEGPLIFNRTPYTIRYVDLKGEQKSIRRVPPEKLHQMLPTDIVELKTKKSDDFNDGDEVTIKSINPRHANTLQLINDDGQTTFMEYFDLDLKQEVAMRGGQDPKDRQINNRYLLWP